MEAEEKPVVKIDQKKIEGLKRLYGQKKEEIRSRLFEFSKIGEEDERRLFAELCFCLCTPQSKAKAAWYKAVCPLMDCGKLYSGAKEEIESVLRASGVRFYRTKAGRIVLAREDFKEKGLKTMILGHEDVKALRTHLVERVEGLGLKEASHFLRNIGLGRDLAILDRHILRNLLELGVIGEIPKSLSKKKYLELEEKMKAFSEEIGIPMDELDMLLWMKETGEIFK